MGLRGTLLLGTGPVGIRGLGEFNKASGEVLGV